MIVLFDKRLHEAKYLENLTMSLIGRANAALNINIVTGVDEALSVHGSDWLWAVTAIYVLSFVSSPVPLALILTLLHLATLLTHRTSQIVLLVLSFAAKESERVFHYLFTFALLVCAITYYAQASDIGCSAVEQIDHLGNGVERDYLFLAGWLNLL